MPLWYDARNDVFSMLNWPNYLSEKVTQYRMKKNTFSLWLLIVTCWKMNCEWDKVKKLSPNCQNRFLKIELRKPSFPLLNFEVMFGAVWIFRKISDIFVRVLHSRAGFFSTRNSRSRSLCAWAEGALLLCASHEELQYAGVWISHHQACHWYALLTANVMGDDRFQRQLLLTFLFQFYTMFSSHSMNVRWHHIWTLHRQLVIRNSANQKLLLSYSACSS